jgi:hypothetical protein
MVVSLKTSIAFQENANSCESRPQRRRRIFR